MATAVYIICASTSTACAILLLRAYRRNRVRLLLWSFLCFAMLAVNNLLIALNLWPLGHLIIPSVALVLLAIAVGLWLRGL